MKNSNFEKNPASETNVRTKSTGNPLGIYQFTLGDLEVSIFRDGHFPLSVITPPDMDPVDTKGINTDSKTRMDYFGPHMDRNRDFQLNISPVLLDFGDRQILIDSGWNLKDAAPTAGNLGTTLEVIGVSPDDIDTIILTHAHPDHLGGLFDPSTQEPTFSNAEIVLSDIEVSFWSSDDAVPILENPLFEETPIILRNIEDRLRVIQPGDEVTSRIQSISSPGHTPGHISLGVETEDLQLLLTGDAITNTHASFEHPDWHNFFDLEPDVAAQSRKRLLDQAATDEMLILGYHLPFPGVGYALEFNDSYYWYPTG